MHEGPLRGARALEAVEQAPEHMVAEVLDGELYLFPRPRVRHARVSTKLGARLSSAFDNDDDDERAHWYLLDEPELHLGDGPDIMVPDIAGWRRERMPKLPNHAFIDLAPDWACEVLSPSTRHVDQGKKRDIYAREGVSHLWFVDPEPRTLEVFELVDRAYRTLAVWSDRDTVEAPPFASLALALAQLWID